MTMTMTREERLSQLPTEELFATFWNAAEHLGTRDLVMYIDPEEGTEPKVFLREKLLARPDLPAVLLAKLSKHAVQASVRLKDAPTAFWLVAEFPEEMICTAVIAKRIGEGGSA